MAGYAFFPVAIGKNALLHMYMFLFLRAHGIYHKTYIMFGKNLLKILMDISCAFNLISLPGFRMYWSRLIAKYTCMLSW